MTDLGRDEALKPTPTGDSLPRRIADFDTLGQALDYAAEGARGLNFHDARGRLARPYAFREMRGDALQVRVRVCPAQRREARTQGRSSVRYRDGISKRIPATVMVPSLATAIGTSSDRPAAE